MRLSMRSAIRFSLFASLAVIYTATLLGQPASPPAAQNKAAYDETAKALHECQRLCDSCGRHCADMVAHGHKEHVKTMQSCQDCAAFCEMTGRIVSARGPYTDVACESCATICGRCAAACEKTPDDAEMRACAEECRRCERACRNMLTKIAK